MESKASENAKQVGSDSRKGDTGKARKNKHTAGKITEQQSMKQAPEPVDATVGSPAFPSMNEPETVDVGHYIFLRCGHNGHFLDSEKKIFMKHLVLGGMLEERDALRCSVMSSGTADKASLPAQPRDSAAGSQAYNLESDAESTVAVND